MPSIDRTSSEPFYHQVYAQIARNIEIGVYPEGKKLPSIRECARDLGVSNTTIELAYQKLTSEGYISARRGSGYTVCAWEGTLADPSSSFTSEYQTQLEDLKRLTQKLPADQALRYDFAYDVADQSLFPIVTWARLCREVFFSKNADQACRYGEPEGLYDLRKQIASYLGTEHDLVCAPEQILVMPTTRDLVRAIAELFGVAETRIVMEEPGYNEVAGALSSLGFEVTSISMHPAPQWDGANSDPTRKKLMFVTPACQFPTNCTMPLELRREIVSWAEENDAYIIDDEYGWEYQTGMTRIPSLAAFDRSGHVITLASFSNVLSPAIAISYAVLPPQLMKRWIEANQGTHPSVSWQTQAAIAAFMRNGHWHAYIKKVRATMMRKRAVLLDALETCFDGELEVLACSGSLFALVRTADGRDDTSLVEAARKAGVAVYPTSCYWQGEAPDDWRFVLIGFAGIAESDIADGIRALADAWA